MAAITAIHGKYSKMNNRKETATNGVNTISPVFLPDL